MDPNHVRTPAVSVIMPVYNAEAHLQTSVGSVLSQSMSDLELLLIDDASTDASATIAQSLAAADNRVRLLQTEGGKGAAAARNTGLARARGRFVAFLDADDAWLERKLERQLEFMRERGAWFAYTAYEKMDEAGQRRARVVRVPAALDHAVLLKGCPIGCSTVMIDTDRTGSFRMPGMKRSQDYACWLELTRHFGPAQGLDEPLTLYREHAGSLSSNKLRKLEAAWRIYRDCEGLSFWRAAYCIAAYSTHGLRKRLI